MNERQGKTEHNKSCEEKNAAYIGAYAVVIAAVVGALLGGWASSWNDKSLDEKSQEIENFFADKYNGFPEGKIIFNCPDDMQLNKPTIIKAYIARNLELNIRSKNSLIQKINKISPIMKSKIEGSAFEIKEITPQKQSTIGEDTVWEWSVTPRQSGSHKLALSVDAIVEIPGYTDRSKNILIIERNVNINPFERNDPNDLDVICIIVLVIAIIVFILNSRKSSKKALPFVSRQACKYSK